MKVRLTANHQKLQDKTLDKKNPSFEVNHVLSCPTTFGSEIFSVQESQPEMLSTVFYKKEFTSGDGVFFSTIIKLA